MKRVQTMLAVLALVALIPAAASAQTGYYTWSISASNMDPFDNTPANPNTAGTLNVYVWLVQGCAPEVPGGMSAAEFKIVVTNWTFLAVTPVNAFLNAGAGQNILLAVGGCPVGPVVAVEVLLLGSLSPGRVGFAITDVGGGLSQQIQTVDCASNPTGWLYPEFMRCIGYATSDNVEPNQDHGTDCGVTSLEETTWGGVKALYR